MDPPRPTSGLKRFWVWSTLLTRLATKTFGVWSAFETRTFPVTFRGLRPVDPPRPTSGLKRAPETPNVPIFARAPKMFDPPIVLLTKTFPVTFRVEGPGAPLIPRGAATLRRLAWTTFTVPVAMRF